MNKYTIQQTLNMCPDKKNPMRSVIYTHNECVLQFSTIIDNEIIDDNEI